MSGYLGMDLPGFIALVRSRARLIGAIVGAAVLLALVASLLQSSRYHATADLLFGPSPAAEALGSSLGDTSDDIPERVAATNLALASLDGVAARVKQQLGTSASVQDLQAAVEVQTAGDSDIGTVTAEWDSADGAAEVANAFAAQIVATRAETSRADLQRAIDALGGALAAQPADAPEAATRALRDRISTLQALAAVDSGGVRVVEPASPPRERSSPRPLRNAVIAGFVALVLALLLVVVLARVDERVADEEQLVGARARAGARAHPRHQGRGGAGRRVRVPPAQPADVAAARRRGRRVRDHEREPRRRQDPGQRTARMRAGFRRRRGRGRRPRPAQARAGRAAEPVL